MATRSDRPDRAVRPVDAVRFYSMLRDALGIPKGSARADPACIVNRPFPHISAENFRDLYLLKEVLRKYPGFDLGVDTQAAAIASFREDEQLNAQTNDRLATYDAEKPHVCCILDAAARKAVRVLGKFSWERFLEGLRFGPGATTRLSRKNAQVARKLSDPPHVTWSAYNLAREVLSVTPMWAWRLTELKETTLPLIVRQYDRATSVPKNAKTDRFIGIGPCMNVYLQLGVGYCMRSAMFRWGINLQDQSINQERARESSIHGNDATIDLRSASNSVTRQAVWRFLGNHSEDRADLTWYRIMDILRTEGAMVEGKPHEYQLFSPMGNGFTFELESLMFWTIAQETCLFLGIQPTATVYGDDLIVPSESVPLLLEVLEYAGFRLNQSKSFWNTDGPLFRESCGKHYLDGSDVTPFYVDTELDSVDAIVVTANNIMRWSARNGCRDGRLLNVWLWLLSHLPERVLNCRIPMSEANDGLIMDFDEACPRVAYLSNRFHRKPIRAQGIPGSISEKGVLLHKEHKSKYAGKTPIGYRVSTVETLRRTVRPLEDDGYVIWHYMRSWKKFRDHSLGEREWYPISPREFKEPKGLKKSLKWGKRVVKDWPNLGPWVDETGSTTYELVDYRVLYWMHRATGLLKSTEPQGKDD